MTGKAIIHLLTEFAPVLAFFVSAQIFDFYTATTILIASTIVAIFIGWIYEQRIPILPLISGLFVIISGSITIIYKTPDALIFADSVYYFLMALAIFVGLYFKFNILKSIFDTTFAMNDTGWHTLAVRWITIFALACLANELVRITLTPEAWVNFRFFKVIAITVFGFYQFTLSKRYRIPEESNSWGLRINNK